MMLAIYAAKNGTTGTCWLAPWFYIPWLRRLALASVLLDVMYITWWSATHSHIIIVTSKTC